MGLTLMADDRDLIIGELVGGFKEIKAHLDRQDKQREAMHTENTGNIADLKNQWAATNAIALDGKRWIDDIGKPTVVFVNAIHDRVKAIEDGRRIADAEERGQMKTWGLVGGGIVTGGGAIGGLIEYWRDIVDFVKGLGHGG